jgi:hypothetical protein
MLVFMWALVALVLVRGAWEATHPPQREPPDVEAFKRNYPGRAAR